MAISPDIRPRVSVPTDYEVPLGRTATTESLKNRNESSSNNSFGYVLGVLVLLIIGYFAYANYGQNTVVPNVTDQGATTVTPPVTPPVTPSVIVPAPSSEAPAVPVTPPATTTTP